jgi:hypothetical protein
MREAELCSLRPAVSLSFDFVTPQCALRSRARLKTATQSAAPFWNACFAARCDTAA